MEVENQISKYKLHTPLICYICGDDARGMNFDVITCMSCKAFFRRHALQPTKKLICLLDNNCIIKKDTRGGCSACRLKKCFLFGMNPNLIRSPYKKEIKPKQKKHVHLSQPRPLSLVNHDRSTLTLDEWNLLSNIINAYEEQNLIVRTQSCFKEQLSLPPKLRSKPTTTLELIGQYYTAVQPLIERCPYFHNLLTDARRIIIQNNFSGTGAFNTMIAAAEANVFENEHHLAICNEIYGADYIKESHRLLTRLEPNRTLLKVMLLVLAFSSNCSIVVYDQSVNFTHIHSVRNLCCIQDIFITMLWKYLVYQHGYAGAVKHIDTLVKNYLDVLKQVHENVSAQHIKMVDVIVEKTTHLLTQDD